MSQAVIEQAPMEALERAIGIAGSQQRLAEGVNVQRPGEREIGGSAISNWKQRGQVPAEMVLPVARAVRYEVLPHELRPDLYPHPEDGLPSELRILGLVHEMSEVLTSAERATLFNAIMRGPSVAIEAIESLDVDLQVRRALLEAASSNNVRP